MKFYFTNISPIVTTLCLALTACTSSKSHVQLNAGTGGNPYSEREAIEMTLPLVMHILYDFPVIGIHCNMIGNEWHVVYTNDATEVPNQLVGCLVDREGQVHISKARPRSGDDDLLCANCGRAVGPRVKVDPHILQFQQTYTEPNPLSLKPQVP